MTGPIEDKRLPFLVAEETGKDHGSIRSLELESCDSIPLGLKQQIYIGFLL